jgi:hypothetical protein
MSIPLVVVRLAAFDQQIDRSHLREITKETVQEFRSATLMIRPLDGASNVGQQHRRALTKSIHHREPLSLLLITPVELSPA